MDKVPSINEITGSILATKASTDAYREGYDRIFKKKEPKKQILLRNKAMCDNCHEVIESKSRHDYISCSCGNLAVDGGLSYTKRNFGERGYTELSFYADEDDIVTIRNHFVWGSYGKNFDEPLHYILLKDLSNKHLIAILETQRQIRGTYIEDVMKLEVAFRTENNIQVKDE